MKKGAPRANLNRRRFDCDIRARYDLKDDFERPNPQTKKPQLVSLYDLVTETILKFTVHKDNIDFFQDPQKARRPTIIAKHPQGPVLAVLESGFTKSLLPRGRRFPRHDVGALVGNIQNELGVIEVTKENDCIALGGCITSKGLRVNETVFSYFVDQKSAGYDRLSDERAVIKEAMARHVGGVVLQDEKDDFIFRVPCAVGYDLSPDKKVLFMGSLEEMMMSAGSKDEQNQQLPIVLGLGTYWITDQVSAKLRP